MQCKIRPFSDLFSSKSKIWNKNLRNSDYLGIFGRDLDSSGIFNFSRHYRPFYYFIQFYSEQIPKTNNAIGQLDKNVLK